MVGRHSFLPRARVLIYGDCGNIGDAIQTVAIARLVGGPLAGIWRDAPMPSDHAGVPFVVNGWLGKGSPIPDGNCLFAGVHLGYREPAYVDWIRQSRYPVGARDEYTRGLLASNRVASELVGCATLALPRYRGPRRGRLSIDVEPVPGTEFATSLISKMSWADQWALALHRLDELRRAEIVYTRRLHVVLPCLGFGTPVVFPLSAFEDLFDKSRLGLLHTIGFTYGEPVEMDVTGLAERFTRFLSGALGRPIEPVDEPVMPVPIMPPPEDGAALVERSLDTALVKARAKQAAPISVTRSPTVTALVFTKDGAARLPECLGSIRRAGFADDIVVCVDTATADDSVEVARAFTPHVHIAPPGYPESPGKFGQAIALCEGDFVLRMDDDERIGGNWDRGSFELLVRFNDLTHFWIPRRWIVPPGDQFIASPPWSTDLGLRVFLNDPRILVVPEPGARAPARRWPLARALRSVDRSPHSRRELARGAGGEVPALPGAPPRPRHLALLPLRRGGRAPAAHFGAAAFGRRRVERTAARIPRGGALRTRRRGRLSRGRQRGRVHRSRVERGRAVGHVDGGRGRRAAALARQANRRARRRSSRWCRDSSRPATPCAAPRCSAAAWWSASGASIVRTRWRNG